MIRMKSSVADNISCLSCRVSVVCVFGPLDIFSHLSVVCLASYRLKIYAAWDILYKKDRALPEIECFYRID
jgi:hypothetical protein